MKIVIVLILLSFSAYGQIGLGFGNGFGNGGGFGNNFGGGNGFGNSFGNNNGNRFGNNMGNGNGFNVGGGNTSGGLGNSNTNTVNNTNTANNTNNVYRPAAVGINQRRKDNNGYDYGVLNSGSSPMFSGRVFQTPLRRVIVGTNSMASIRQYLRLNSREGQFEIDPQMNSQTNSQSSGQNNSNRVNVGSMTTKAGQK